MPTPTDSPVKITRALLSVSDKTGLADLGTALAKHGVELVSTGGTAKALREAGLEVRDVSDLTGFPEMMDGRVKTLHPKVHGGLLAMRDNEEHKAAMEAHDIGAIDLVVVNLYPFAETVASGAGRADIIENIDIGGPSMVRSAAKNHAHVAIVTDPADYDTLTNQMDETDGATTLAFRRKCAEKAFSLTATYDAMISTWFSFGDQNEAFPEIFQVPVRRVSTLRYGENPHQMGALYVPVGPGAQGVGQAEQVQGKELSYNNLNDADAALELVSEFEDATPACVIVKHANPCGVAIGDDLAGAYKRALACDTESAFGGILAFNRELDAETAALCADLFAEVIIAPAIADDAKAVFQAKKNLRVLETGALPDARAAGMTVRSLAGGYLLQNRDAMLTSDELKVVTKRQPTDAEMADLLFAFTVCKHVKSNAIIYVKDGATVGVGAGQMSRVNSSRIAAWKAADAARVAGDAESWAIGSVVASDAFFPFRDGVDVLAEAGATAIAQPVKGIRTSSRPMRA